MWRAAAPGARLLRSHRVQLPAAQNGTPRDGEVEPAEEGGEDACSTEEKERSRAEVGDAAGMAWLESPGGTVRVLLLDERLLCAPVPLAGGSRGRGDGGGLSDPSGSTSREPLATGERGMAGEDSSVGDVSVASEPGYGSFPSLLLLGIAAMAEQPGEEAAVFPPDASRESTIAPHEPGREPTASPRNASGEVTMRNDNSNDSCRLRANCEKSNGMAYQDSVAGDSVSSNGLRREAGRSVINEHGGGSGSNGERGEVGLDVEAPYREGRRPDQSQTEPINRVNGLTPTSSTKVYAEPWEAGPRRMVSTDASQSNNATAGTSDGGDQVVEQSGAGAEQYQEPGGVPKEGVVDNTGSAGVGVVNGEARLEEVSGGRRTLAPGWERAERPFPMLDVSMLGNLGGPIRVVPNR